MAKKDRTPNPRDIFASPTNLAAIRTSYVPATNTRGARVRAVSSYKVTTIPYNDELSDEGNHAEACKAVVNANMDGGGGGWDKGRWFGARTTGLDTDGMYWVCAGWGGK